MLFAALRGDTSWPPLVVDVPVDTEPAGPVRILFHAEHRLAAVPVQRHGQGGEELLERNRICAGAGFPRENAAIGDFALVAFPGHERNFKLVHHVLDWIISAAVESESEGLEGEKKKKMRR